ncbi:MAG TPA: hypothetical protein VJR02_26785 [Pyrinomonadaceae bacterium]|nr:hypothetical protein [Pyrinomonadaceae bacterium]
MGSYRPHTHPHEGFVKEKNSSSLRLPLKRKERLKSHSEKARRGDPESRKLLLNSQDPANKRVKPVALERKADTHIINSYLSFLCFLSSDFFGEPLYYLVTLTYALRRVILFTEIIPFG